VTRSSAEALRRILGRERLHPIGRLVLLVPAALIWAGIGFGWSRWAIAVLTALVFASAYVQGQIDADRAIGRLLVERVRRLDGEPGREEWP
jgi:hypothetical protein